MAKDLPLYKITIDDEYGDDLGIELISFVKSPAILVKGFAFNQQIKKIKFSTDETKMRIIAPALIPMDIYRLDEDGAEYEVQFDVDTIEKIRNKFMMNLTNRNIFNLEHTKEIAPAHILETWIVETNPREDKAYTKYGIEVPTGTMMLMSQVTDKDYYDNLVANEQFAYSIEGMFGFSNLILSEMINKNKNKINMDEMKLPDGEHTIGDKIYVIQDGKVLEIKDVVKAEEIKEEDKPVETPKEDEIKAEEVVETPVVDEPIIEDKPVSIDEQAVLDLIQPKLDEIYKMIADLTAKIDDAQTEEIVEETPVAMTIHQKFANVINKIKE